MTRAVRPTPPAASPATGAPVPGREQASSVGFVSLGCPKNLVDSEVMIGLAQAAGHTITADPAEADVLVVNTCAFIDSAKQESIDTILELAQLKASGRCRRLVVTGCLAERYRDELRAEIPEIDVTLGTGEVPDIAQALAGETTAASGVPMQYLGRRSAAAGTAVASPPAAPIDLPSYLYDADTPRVLTTPGHYAYLKVAEGCDYACAFCIIPTLRGHYRSRTPESILEEARSLAARGVRELLLISQDTTFYGNDRGERGGLGRLLRALDEVPGLEWIRLLYLYPTTITDDTLEAMATCESVCPYIDLPLQHASDAVLRRMKRPGTRRQYERLIESIRRRMPEVALRTTFIVGFPGETEADIEALEDFVRTVQFDHVGVFTYSHEEGTSAHGLEDDVRPAVKRQRRDRIMRLQQQIVASAQRARIGDRVRVLVDGTVPGESLAWQGRLRSQAPEIDAVVYLTDLDPVRHPAGSFVEARITGARGYDLVAAPLP